MLITGHLFASKSTQRYPFCPVTPENQILGGVHHEGQTETTDALRREGAGYGSIACQLGLSINTVKSFCQRHSQLNRSQSSFCEQCGRPIEQIPGRKRKRFCCDACRNKWWNSHLDLVKRKAVYTFTCPACGKEFTIYGNRRRKFCSHACYIAYRFGGVRHG